MTGVCGGALSAPSERLAPSGMRRTEGPALEPANATFGRPTALILRPSAKSRGGRSLGAHLPYMLLDRRFVF